MANSKPKKSGKKPAAKPESTKDVKETKEAKVVAKAAEKETKATEKPAVKAAGTVVVTAPCERPLKGFFARKYAANESILTIFKTPKIWGALLGELIGTMFLVMLLLTLGITPLYIWIGIICIYAAVVGISGANLNPLVTVGMMASRRMSAIRGVLYMLAQLLGGWVGMIIVNAFRIGSASGADLPMMSEVSTETFLQVALVELLGAFVIAFCFCRIMRYGRKQPLAFSFVISSAIMLAIIFGSIISQSYFGATGNTFMFNPVAALMYQVLPTAADNFGELAGKAGLAIAAYVLVPMLGGVIGFYISDVATRLSCGGYLSEADEQTCDKK